MAETLETKLRRLRELIDSFKARERALEERNASLEAENAELRRQAAEALQARDRAALDAEFLAVSHKLADDPDTLVVTRRKIAGLIRNIDRCLEMLKE